MRPEPPPPEIASLVRRHRVHFDVEPELYFRGREKRAVGFEVHLWAILPRGARATPGCPACRALARDLQRIGREVIQVEEGGLRLEWEPPRSGLYASAEFPDADEVCLPVRLLHDRGYEQPVDADQLRWLRDLRRRMKSVGVREQ